MRTSFHERFTVHRALLTRAAAAWALCAADARAAERVDAGAGWTTPAVERVLPGVWRVRIGKPERFTPDTLREASPAVAGFARLPDAPALPFKPEDVRGRVTSSRTVVYVPCDEPADEIFGFGLDPRAYAQKGLRKVLTVCAGVLDKTGASHGPVPFYVSTRGYGVYVDTARVPVVQVARLTRKGADAPAGGAPAPALKTSAAELYAAQAPVGRSAVVFEIPGNSRGVDVYLFGGPTLREAVQRYNLFSGGGAVPPLWGLGMKYRTFTGADQATVLNVARALRAMGIPCDMLGLEPGWQSRAYPCSLTWSQERFPNPGALVREVTDLGYRPNLWEHAYIHPESPLHGPLQARSADYLVWGGLVVDFADPEAFRLFADYHARELVAKGIGGFKADECDAQPILDCTPFNYPTFSLFPSGIDGDQMTQLYGYLYQRSIHSVFRQRNQRTWGDVRATAALAAPLPFNLYSDAYEFDEYLRQLVNASFAGLLWSPEVRDAGSVEELLNRIALSAFAPQMCLNIWFMPHPVWEQYAKEPNCQGRLLPADEQRRLAERIRDVVSLRYRLLPYLYASFHRYRTEGLPPVRSPLLDFPADPALRKVDNEFLFGDGLLVAPFMGRACVRKVYFPKGCDWVEWQTGIAHAGGTTGTFQGEPGETPLFVRLNTLLPLAAPVQHVGRDTVFAVTVKVFGDRPAPLDLIEDDGETFAFETGAVSRVTLAWTPDKGGTVARKGGYRGERYRIAGWEPVKVAAAAPPGAGGADPARLPGVQRLSDGATFRASSALDSDPASGQLLAAGDDAAPFAFHTREEEAPHVIIDLKREREVAGLTLVNRVDERPEIRARAASLAAWTSADGDTWKTVWLADGPETEWRCVLQPPVPARYVKVGLRSRNFLHLKRVFVWGRDPPNGAPAQ